MKSMDQVLTRDAIYLAIFYNKLFTNRSFFSVQIFRSFEFGIKGYWNKVFVIEGNNKQTTHRWSLYPTAYIVSHLGSSLGPGSAVGEKGKKRSQIGKKRQSKRAKRYPPPFPLPRLPLNSLRSPILFFSPKPIFFSFFPQCGAWFRLLRKVSF